MARAGRMPHFIGRIPRTARKERAMCNEIERCIIYESPPLSCKKNMLFVNVLFFLRSQKLAKFLNQPTRDRIARLRRVFEDRFQFRDTEECDDRFIEKRKRRRAFGKEP